MHAVQAAARHSGAGRPDLGSWEDTVDVRIVSATWDLNAGVRTGLFRRDLYYRLNVIEIAVPALRERA
jgi:two-component system response regulator PilR (NtrC family)